MALIPDVLSVLNLKSALACGAVFLLVTWYIRRPRNLPPGPSGLPLVGYLPMMMLHGDEYKFLTEIAKRYGEVFSLNLGGQLAVVLNSYETIKKALNHPNTTDRPPSKFFSKVTPDPEALGVVSGSGACWHEQRKFSLTVLKGLGVGKRSFEDAIATEAKCLTKEMKDFKETPFNPTRLVCNAVSNVICSVILGERFEYSDPKFEELLALVNRNFEIVGGGSLATYVPILQKMTFMPTFKELHRNMMKIMQFLKDCIEDHDKNWDPNNLRDFIDVYLLEIKNNEKNNIQNQLNANNMIITLFEIFVAGTETTSSTLRWALLYMMANPEVQARVQQELDEVVGRNRLPLLADKTELPYTEATILEVQRVASIAGIDLPHVCSQDTALFGYDLPKGTVLLANLWALNRDPNLWPDPEKFSPERFLDADGKVKRREELLPFSTGRRACLGEQLAKMELFIFFSFLLHQFTFKKPDDAPPLSFKIVNGLTLAPTPFETCAVLRE